MSILLRDSSYSVCLFLVNKTGDLLIVCVLDEESALSLPGDVSKDVQDFLRQTWTEEFCPVAQSLLARIQSCYRELEPI